jgi:hypothetical protein
MDRPISKKAVFKEALANYMETVWNKNDGPFENLLRIASYAAIPFLGSLGRIVSFILTKIALSMLGLPPGYLGKLIDEKLGLGPGDDPRQPGMKEKAEEVINDIFESRMESKAAANNDPHPISKTAGIMAALQVGRKIGGYLWKAVSVLASVYVFTAIEKVWREQISDPVREQLGEWGYPEKVIEKAKGITETIGDEAPERKSEKSVEEIADYLEQKYGLK